MALCRELSLQLKSKPDGAKSLLPILFAAFLGQLQVLPWDLLICTHHDTLPFIAKNSLPTCTQGATVFSKTPWFD